MKPIKLTLTAFGAYKEKEVIDFDALQGQRLFVISGNTGAGKTTIFDGICFALYGTASGSDRENSGMLRSHFAEDDVHTSVDFEFEIKGRTFRVFRQLAHKKIGNKSKTGDKNELYEQTNQGEVPIVDRQMVSEVNIKMEQLIGLTEDQFKQIVMLPQGEFRKLLTSETENKEAILRRLFKTERYKAMNQLLKDKIDVIEKDFSKEKQRLDHYMESIQNTLTYRKNAPVFMVLEQAFYHASQIVTALEEEKAYIEGKILFDEKQYKEKQAVFGHQQEKFHQGKTLNERFELLDKQQKELNELLAQAEAYETHESNLKAAEQANMLMPYENHVKERKHEHNQLMEQMEQSEKALQIASKAYQTAMETYQGLESKDEERANQKARITRYEEYIPIVKEANQTKEVLINQYNKLKKMDQDLHKMGKKQEIMVGKITGLKQSIQEQEKEMEPLHSKQLKVLHLRDQYKVVRDYVEAEQQVKTSKLALKEVEQDYQKVEQNYKNKEAVWLDNQALVLAGHLVEGEACPVCGSAHHPAKATANGFEASKDELDVLKKKLESQLKLVNQARSTHQSNENDLKKALQQLDEYQITTKVTADLLEELAMQGKKVKQEVEHLQQTKTRLQENKKTLEELEVIYEKGRKELQLIERHYHEEQVAYSSGQATFTEKMNQIPNELQDFTGLQDTLKQMKQIAQKADHAWQEAQRQLKEKETNYTTKKATLHHKKEQFVTIKKVVQQVQSTFQEKLKTANFATVEAYEKAKMEKEKREQLSMAVESYKEKKLTLNQQVTNLELELKGKEKVNMEALQVMLMESKQAYETALTTWNQSKSELLSINQFIQQIKEAEERTAALEQELSTMTDVYNMVRGQNPMKVSFERYLQIDYLDQIIRAANGRFKQLMNGQFYLLRSDRQEAYGKQSGLAIDVYDGYTGQTRDVKSLSGGEKFIASLCLALGMSDVIQSYQGSISIETMFIDEGFGSLDEESLHKSIDALIQIQQTGRMIGVISHVEELKNIFPAMLKVTKTKEGYSKAEFVIK